MIDKYLLSILVCPACHQKLAEEENELTCQKCLKRFPIENGIPIMLLDKNEEKGGNHG